MTTEDPTPGGPEPTPPAPAPDSPDVSPFEAPKFDDIDLSLPGDADIEL
jgi:hypothetical protein